MKLGNFTQIRQHTKELLSSNCLDEVGSIFRETTALAMDEEIWGEFDLCGSKFN